MRRIEQRVTAIERAQQEIIAILTAKAWTVDKVIIENMRTERVELNLDRVEVQELSGMLSIGLNYGGRLVKLDREDAGPRKGHGTVAPGGPAGRGRDGPVINIRYGRGREGGGRTAGRPAESAPFPSPVAAKTRRQ